MVGDDYYGCDCDMCLRIRYEARLAACEALVESWRKRRIPAAVCANELEAAIRGETNDAKR